MQARGKEFAVSLAQMLKGISVPNSQRGGGESGPLCGCPKKSAWLAGAGGSALYDSPGGVHPGQGLRGTPVPCEKQVSLPCNRWGKQFMRLDQPCRPFCLALSSGLVVQTCGWSPPQPPSHPSKSQPGCTRPAPFLCSSSAASHHCLVGGFHLHLPE